MKQFLKFALLIAFLFEVQSFIAQEVTTTTTTSSSICDGTATLINPPPAQWTWVWKHYSGTVYQTGGTFLANMCSSGVHYLVEFSAPGETTYSVPFYINDNCYSFSYGLGSDDTAPDECTGFAIAYLTGGIPPYTSQWSNGVNSDTISQLCAGTYALTVTDAQGCIKNTSVTIEVDSTMSSTMSMQNDSIVHDNALPACTGSISFQINGGCPPYSLSWSNGFTSPYTNDSLCPGDYTLLVTDACGETLVDTFTIESAAILFSGNPFPDSTIVSNLDLGLIENCDIDYATIDTAYLFSAQLDTLSQQVYLTWLVVDAVDSTFYTDSISSVSLNGVYELIIGFYCPQKSVASYFGIGTYIYIGNNSTGVSGLEELKELLISVHPNPFDDEINIQLSEKDDYCVTLFDLKGQIIHREEFPSTLSMSINGLIELEKGVYLVKIQSNKRTVTRIVIRN